MITRRDIKTQRTEVHHADKVSAVLDLRVVKYVESGIYPSDTVRQDELARAEREAAAYLWRRLYGDLHDKLRALDAELAHAPEGYWTGGAKVEELERLTSFESFMTRK